MNQAEMIELMANRLESHTYWHPGSCECGKWRADSQGDVNWARQWALHVSGDLLEFVEKYGPVTP